MIDERRGYFNDIALDWNEMVPFADRFSILLNKCNIGPGEKVMDIGAGTGRSSVSLEAMVGTGGKVVSVDFAFLMMQEAQKFPHNGALKYVCADALYLAFRDNYFDKIICYSAFPHFRDQKRALLEMKRVLKPGGTLFIIHIEGSKTLNAFHKNLGGAVGEDVLPAGIEMQMLMQKCRLVNIEVIDSESLYWASAQRE